MKKAAKIIRDIGWWICVVTAVIFFISLLSNLAIFKVIFAFFYATIGALFSAFNG